MKFRSWSKSSRRLTYRLHEPNQDGPGALTPDPRITHTMETNQIVVSSGTNSVAAYHKQATDVAGVCKDIVQETAQKIGGRKYVRVEGWQAIATAHGCVASARDVERIEGGWRAIGEVRRMDNGNVIATAEGFLGEDEPVWAKRPEYAKRAMCQTRAISRACRSAFAHVVVLIGGGLETTPAEEVPSEGFADVHPKPAPRLVDATDVIDVVPERIRNIAEDTVKLHTPDAKLRKKQPVAAAEDGADMTEATLIEVQEKHGEGKKGPWTCWKATLEINGRKVYPSTFEADLGDVLNSCDPGDTLMVKLAERPYTDRNGETKKGYDLVFATKANVPAKAEDKVIEWGTKEEDSDSIPF